MIDLVTLGRAMGSLRYARDILESKNQVLTRPWWPVPRNTWASAEISEFIEARGERRGIESPDFMRMMRKNKEAPK